MLTSGKLEDYLADLNEQAETMSSRLVKELAEKEGITEKTQSGKSDALGAVDECSTGYSNGDCQQRLDLHITAHGGGERSLPPFLFVTNP